VVAAGWVSATWRAATNVSPMPSRQLKRHWVSRDSDTEAAFVIRTLLIHEYRKIHLQTRCCRQALYPVIGWGSTPTIVRAFVRKGLHCRPRSS